MNKKSWYRANTHVFVGCVLAIAFVILRPPVPDLQAADARASAVWHGVGSSYWFSWFGGTSPGTYSLLTPLVSALLGTAATAALAVVVISVAARPLVAGGVRPVAAQYAVVIAALCNLWSGRVAFCLGAAIAVLAVIAVRQSRPWLGGALNLAAALASPLAAVFALLGFVGVAVVRRDSRSELLPFMLLSCVGIGAPTLLFGDSGAMSFATTTYAWAVAIPLAAATLRLPTETRVTLLAGSLVATVLWFEPFAVGSTIVRFSAYVVPPLVIATARSGRRMVAVYLLPVVFFCGQYLIGDLANSTRPSAKAGYFDGLSSELAAQPDVHNHRVEVIDTTTHRGYVALADRLYLARGWEVQQDRATNRIFFDPGTLTPASYRRWLDQLATGWVAVPDEPGGSNVAEVRLIAGGLPYLHKVWSDQHWTLYAVSRPQSIVPAPAHLDEAAPASITLSVPGQTSIVVRVRPSRHLTIAGATITRNDRTSIRIMLPAAGSYRLHASSYNGDPLAIIYAAARD